MNSDPGRLPLVLSLSVHELRTPLAVASGYVRMLLREQAGAIADAQRRMLEETANSCARIGALVEEMAELEKLEAGELDVPKVPFDLAALVGEIAGAGAGDDWRGRVEARAPLAIMVAGDRVRLAAAIRALADAALREQREAGVILMECFTQLRHKQRWALVTIGGEAVAQTLADVAWAGSPRFDEWQGGLGFGLPIARRVIEAHGGAVWSAPGPDPRAGSAVRLPVAPSRN